MQPRNWSKSELEYSRRVVTSALEGARSGREDFLKGRSLTPFLSQGIRNALKPAALGACVGALGSLTGDNYASIGRALAFAFTGWAIGLGAGLAWQTRGLTACATNGALRKVGRLRDQHWLERHPIDYA